jgi:DNA-directed RNA polymerase subunit K/omega
MDMDDEIVYDLENEEDIEDDDDFEEEDIEGLSSLNFNNKKNEKKTTLPVMTKYEKSVIIAKRMKLIDNNYKTTIPEIVKELSLTNSFDISMKEFELKKLPPYIFKRVFFDGRYEEWKHEDFLYYPQN